MARIVLYYQQTDCEWLIRGEEILKIILLILSNVTIKEKTYEKAINGRIGCWVI